MDISNHKLLAVVFTSDQLTVPPKWSSNTWYIIILDSQYLLVVFPLYITITYRPKMAGIPNVETHLSLKIS